MPTRTKTVSALFDDDEIYTTEQIADRLKATNRQVCRWINERKFPENGVIILPQKRRIYGWAANEFVASRLLGGS